MVRYLTVCYIFFLGIFPFHPHPHPPTHSASRFPNFLLSPTLGTLEERGIRKLKQGSRPSAAELEGMRSYDLPFGMDFLRRHTIFQYLPISPTFTGYRWGIPQGTCQGQGDRGGRGEAGKAGEIGGDVGLASGESGV